MNEIPSVLQSILKKRYLNEAVTMAPQVSYTKKKEEEEQPLPAPRFAPTVPSGTPELTMPAASEFPSPKTQPTLNDILKGIVQKTQSPLEPSIEPVKKPISSADVMPTELSDADLERILKRSKQRYPQSNIGNRDPDDFRPGQRMYSGFPPVPEELTSATEKAAKSVVQKAIAGASKFDAYATQKAPYSWSTIKDLPKHGMYFGASIPVFDAFYRAAEQHTPFEPGLGGMDPYSFGAGTVGTSATIPFAMETAHGLGRGLGLAGALGQGLGAAGAALASGWTIIPPLAYAGAYGMSKAEEAAEPYREEKAKEIDAYLDYEKTKRRLEGRKPSFWERYSEEELERSKFNPLGAADWGR